MEASMLFMVVALWFMEAVAAVYGGGCVVHGGPAVVQMLTLVRAVVGQAEEEGSCDQGEAQQSTGLNPFQDMLSASPSCLWRFGRSSLASDLTIVADGKVMVSD
eukprot:695986-Rhodomonas_salina.3